METWDAIRSRRDVRDFSDRRVRGGDLDRILEAGRRTPSSNNWQPWDFVLVTDREQLQALAKVWRGAWHVAKSAATIALILPEPKDESRRAMAQFDLGQATMSMMLAAADLGLGTAHAFVDDQALARSILGFPEDRYCAYLITVGYPQRRLRLIKRPHRRPFDEVVHRDRW